MRTNEQAPLTDIHDAYIEALRNGDAAKDVTLNKFTKDVTLREAARGYTATRAHGEGVDPVSDRKYDEENPFPKGVDQHVDADDTEALNAREGKENPTDDDVEYYRWLKNSSGRAEKPEEAKPKDDEPKSEGPKEETPVDPVEPKDPVEPIEKNPSAPLTQAEVEAAGKAATDILEKIAKDRFEGNWSKSAEQTKFLEFMDVVKQVYGTDDLEDPRVKRILADATDVTKALFDTIAHEQESSPKTTVLGRTDLGHEGEDGEAAAPKGEKNEASEKLKIIDSYSRNRPNIEEKHDDDRWFEDRDTQSFGVFDGVGGAEKGALGAEITKNTVAERLSAISTTVDSHKDVPRKLEDALVVAANNLTEHARESGVPENELQTTAIATKVVEDADGTWLCYALVGDSPLFIAHEDGSYEQVGEEDLAKPDTEPNVISDVIQPGFRGVRNPKNIGAIKLSDGDKVVLCSDGITGDWTGKEPNAKAWGKTNEKLSDEEFKDAFGQSTVKGMVDQLFAHSKKNDDKTAVAFEVSTDKDSGSTDSTRTETYARPSAANRAAALATAATATVVRPTHSTNETSADPLTTTVRRPVSSPSAAPRVRAVATPSAMPLPVEAWHDDGSETRVL